jgi:hypothetical protein
MQDKIDYLAMLFLLSVNLNQVNYKSKYGPEMMGIVIPHNFAITKPTKV